MHRATGITAAFTRLSRKVDSRPWVSFIGNGLRLVSAHQEPPSRDVIMKGATTVHQLITKLETTLEVSYMG